MDEQQREHLRDDLKGLIKGELRFDPLTRALYSTDASIFEVTPLGVVAPRDEEDVQALVRYAAEHGVPLVPRGAGSGLAGEALGPGLVVDFSRYFRGIVQVGADTVRVQPGVVYRELNERLAREGRRFAPDPASGSYCTVGGMLATNASGTRALGHGYTRDHAVSLRAVLDTGDVAELGWERRSPSAGPAGHAQDIALAVAALLEQHADTVRQSRPRTPFNRCGYLLHDVLGPGHLDMARLLVGSEGTLALFTEATLRTVPLPGGRSAVLLGFESLDAALEAARASLATGPVACELIEHRLLTLSRGSDAALAALVPPGAEVVLLIEYEADSPGEASCLAGDLAARFSGAVGQAVIARVATESEAVDRLWKVRDAALPSLYGMRGGAHPVPLIEDVGVPVEELPGYLRRVQEVLQQHETTASFLVHAGTGQVHTRPFVDLREPKEVARLWSIADAVHGLAIELGGTVSAQHGTGLARTPWVARQYGPLYPVLREIKAIFDPKQIFNPGKIIGPAPDMPVWPLRTVPPAAADPPAWRLKWGPAEVEAEVSNCNGCGQCRAASPGQRMCPVFHATAAEEAAPRAKANLLRHLLHEGENGRLLSADEVRAVADLCVNCKMCARECPSHVNVPKLMLEAKAANVAEHGLDWSDWLLARTESFAAFGSMFAGVVNYALANRSARWLLDKLFGLSRRRRLPAFAGRSFLRRAARRGWTHRPRRGRPQVAFFVDVFANYNDPLIAEAAVAVLQHNGIDVYVPPGQQGCGMAPLAQGDVEAAREAARANLLVLAELAREGLPIVCSEPTAAVMLGHDYLDLVGDSDARLVADRVVELTNFLWDRHQRGALRTDFEPLNLGVGHHVPCHLKALGRPPAGPALLALIPELRVFTIDLSCSGMAGTYGLKADNYATSLAAGRPMLQALRQPGVAYGSTECSTCRMQMQDAGRRRTLHPVQYMALAYGLMPELARRLREPLRGLVVR
jgi:FAD/FMN-containing dehydrogenase/Fe-S oxidoreductase